MVLANISRSAFTLTDLGQVIPPERVICQDEMVESVDAEAFQQRLWGMFGVTFRCRVMDLRQEQLARSMGEGGGRSTGSAEARLSGMSSNREC